MQYANTMIAMDPWDVLPPVARGKFQRMTDLHAERRATWAGVGEQLNAAQVELENLPLDRARNPGKSADRV